MFFRVLKNTVLFFLIIVLFASCNQDQDLSFADLEYNPEEHPEYSFVKWNNDNPLYKIIYDSATDTFSSDYDNVVF